MLLNSCKERWKFHHRIILISHHYVKRYSGVASFHRSPTLVSPNTWHGIDLSASAISFNGNGYLKVEQLANIPNFNQLVRGLNVYTRPNNESDGLVLYAYDTTVSTGHSHVSRWVGQAHMHCHFVWYSAKLFVLLLFSVGEGEGFFALSVCPEEYPPRKDCKQIAYKLLYSTTGLY